MNTRKLLCFIVILAFIGCTGPKPRPPAEAKADANLLEPLALKEKPKVPIMTVAQVRTDSNNGDEVVLEGRIPPDSAKPFVDGSAAFAILDPKDFDEPEIQEALECPD